jgi:hypothetical protein
MGTQARRSARRVKGRLTIVARLERAKSGIVSAGLCCRGGQKPCVEGRGPGVTGVGSALLDWLTGERCWACSGGCCSPACVLVLGLIYRRYLGIRALTDLPISFAEFHLWRARFCDHLQPHEC